ncbi:hypothetical protein I6U33_25940 [Pseudomonas carnis]|uniref:DUF7706 family protein n=1 Tax=Pseudomonas carnis TaxID=2487355 RepID=UPI001C6FA7F4|nr:hypothetical protein [Pseudomonas carnis]MBW9240776.1 hypothetical protein [Pseudomonas carnis]
MSKTSNLISVTAGEQTGYDELTDAQTEALAQFAKRLTWTDIRGCAVDDDEAYEMRAAVGKLQNALALAGYAPR